MTRINIFVNNIEESIIDRNNGSFRSCIFALKAHSQPECTHVSLLSKKYNANKRDRNVKALRFCRIIRSRSPFRADSAQFFFATFADDALWKPEAVNST